MVPGTKMSFAGACAAPTTASNLFAFLRTQERHARADPAPAPAKPATTPAPAGASAGRTARNERLRWLPGGDDAEAPGRRSSYRVAPDVQSNLERTTPCTP